MNYSLLLSDEEYQTRFQKKPQTPYTFEVFSEKQAIFYFGSKHSHDPHDDQWQKLENYWNKFLKETKGKRIAFLEGSGGFGISDLTREEIIKRFGETGLLVSLAKIQNIPLVWPDLSIQQEAKLLEEKFEKDLVEYFIFVRSVGAWSQIDNAEIFNEIIKKAVNATAKRIPNAPAEIEFYASIHRRIFGKNLTPTERENLITAAAPVYHKSIINDIARASSLLRNQRVISEVERFWLDGNSIFILFGSAHAIIQEKALNSLSKNLI